MLDAGWVLEFRLFIALAYISSVAEPWSFFFAFEPHCFHLHVDRIILAFRRLTSYSKMLPVSLHYFANLVLQQAGSLLVQR
jgi:hypothetical protein